MEVEIFDARAFIAAGGMPAITGEDNPVETHDPPINQSAGILPDMRVCRAAELTDSFAECLVGNPVTCQYAMPFGYSYLCGHPERGTIIDNTNRLQIPRRPLPLQQPLRRRK